MAFLDFLKRPKQDGPGATLEDCEAALAKLHEDRARAEEFLANIDARRTDLLMNDADPKKIQALDIEGDVSRLQLEKFELFEAEIVNRLAHVHGLAAEQDWRRAYDAMHMAAMSFAQKMSDCLGELYAFRAAAGELNRFNYGMRRPSGPPVILGNEALQNWLRDLEADHDFELNRRARQGP
jgi:hypothetical protein